MTPKFSMLIQWSDEDQLFIVSLPEFGPFCHTHGSTYEEAAKMGQECLESLIDAYQAWGHQLPEPTKFTSIDSEESEDDPLKPQQPQPAGK
jgi:predicted RNase H-like HicB family nuclease